MNYNKEHNIKRLFDEHFHQLVFDSFRIINDYGQAEDIVQDVFVKVWQNQEKIAAISDIKSYLFKAVRNSSLNYLRHLKIKQNYISDNEVINNSLEKSHDEIIHNNETANKIHGAVDKLPDNWKEAFVLSKYDELKYHEIAEKMKISQKTVEKYISKALNLLRLELKDLLFLIFFVKNF